MLRMRKRFFLLLIILFVVFTLIGMTGCLHKKNFDDGKLKIVATIFPNYDFARQIVGDKAEVILLMPPGVEAHSYDPSPKDIVNASSADIFIYTGAAMEPWADKIINSIKNERQIVVESGKDIELAKEEETEGHDHGTDPHIWINPLFAIKMVENISGAVIEADPENEDFYRKNCEKFIEQLKNLDKEIEKSLSQVENKTIIYGGHFVFGYFAERYGLEFISPYKGFSPDSEPTPLKIAELITKMKELNVKVIFYEELVEPKVARVISQQTGAKMLLLSGAHNVSKKDFDSGVTYIDIMKKNLENLKQGLGHGEQSFANN